jgi:hypothetical protein
MNFIKSGAEGRKFFEEESVRRAEQGNDLKGNRFKLKKNSTGHIVFFDDLDCFFLEHQFFANNNYYNFETCIKDIEGECPLCENTGTPALVSVATVFDLTERTRKDGSIIKPGKKVIVLKKGGTERFLRKQEKTQGLKMKKFEIYRSSDPKGESTGTEIEFEKAVDIDALRQFCPENENFDDWIKPFDYSVLFAPKTVEELRKISGVGDPVGSAESKESAGAALHNLL